MYSAVLDLEQLQDFAKECAASLQGGEVLALIGPLGAGKTTFSKALLTAVGAKGRITSPTFSIINQYRVSQKTFFHVDLYRISGLPEFRTLGIQETWQQPDAIYIIEWADKILRKLPKHTVIIKFSVVSEHTRRISISSR